MLKTLDKIFNEMNIRNIDYLHWKSNEHLDAALNGDTDLDILVNPDHLKGFIHIIESYGFTQYQAIGKQKYITVFDFIKLDEESQKTLHIHLHNSFLTGAKFLKEYSIPIHELLHASKKPIELKNNAIPTINYTLEFLILWIRYCLKTNLLKFVLSGGKISKDFKRESEWLENKITKNEIEEFLDPLLIKDKKKFIRLLDLFLKKDKKGIYLILLIIELKSNYKVFKTERAIGLKYTVLRMKMILNYFLQKKMDLPIPYRRNNPAGGKIIAFIGVDGSGKSTITNKLKSELEKKVDVYFEYLGSGDGSSSLIRKPLKILKKIFVEKKYKEKDKSIDGLESNTKISLLKSIWAITLAYEKKIKLEKVWKAKARGMLVICDRYPQTEILGINDGPLLSDWKQGGNRLKKKIGEWEFSIYESAKHLKPDLMIKLLADFETSQARKPQENPHVIKRKVEIIHEIQIPAEHHYNVDATKPLSKVISEVYHEVSKII